MRHVMNFAFGAAISVVFLILAAFLGALLSIPGDAGAAIRAVLLLGAIYGIGFVMREI